jgi:nicotinamide-nucleotide amidase
MLLLEWNSYATPPHHFAMNISPTERERVLATAVVELAQRRGWRLATAESFTAGLIAHLLSQVKGAGKCLHGGLVTYSKDMKTSALGVPSKLLATQTAVCAEVATAMAAGAISNTPADASMAVTGVAGPDRDEDHNPVGLVFVAVATPEIAAVQRLHLGDRPPEQIISESICAALTLFLERAGDPLTSDGTQKAVS